MRNARSYIITNVENVPGERRESNLSTPYNSAFCLTGKKVRGVQFARSLRSLRTKVARTSFVPQAARTVLRGGQFDYARLDLNGGAAPFALT